MADGADTLHQREREIEREREGDETYCNTNTRKPPHAVPSPAFSRPRDLSFKQRCQSDCWANITEAIMYFSEKCLVSLATH